MKALITGASAGLGKEFAKLLSDMGYDLIVVARRAELLKQLKETLNTSVTVIGADLTDKNSCVELYQKVKDEDIDILINNAGFGDCGYFEQTDIARETLMIDLNITALYTLTKLFYKDFVKKDKGYILNVASIAGIMPGGPYMAQYYATKAYVLSLTKGLYQELKNKKSNVHICALCPGPVDTEFNDNANVSFALKGANAKYVVKYTIKKMFKKKLIIVPVFKIKLSALAAKFLPNKLVLKIASGIQKSKFTQK